MEIMEEIVIALKALRTMTGADLMKFVDFPELLKGGVNWSRNIIYRDGKNEKVVSITLNDIGRFTLFIKEFKDIVGNEYQTIRKFNCAVEFTYLDALFDNVEYKEIVEEYLNDETLIKTQEEQVIEVIRAVYDRVGIDFLADFGTVMKQAITHLMEQDEDASAKIEIVSNYIEYVSGTQNTIIRRYDNGSIYVYHSPHAAHRFDGGASECACNSYFEVSTLIKISEENDFLT